MSDPEVVFSCPPELGAVSELSLLSERHGHKVLRVSCDLGRVIVKQCDSRIEVDKHALLEELGVPVPAIRFRDDNLIVMQDLNEAPWRLAVQEDLEDCRVGEAVARWYRQLHELGDRYLATQEWPDFLTSEIDYLSPAYLERIGARFELQRHRKWNAISQMLSGLVEWVRAQPLTLNYNDFYYTNLAFKEATEGNENEAIVFDYHLLGYGMVASDIRNVISALSPKAALAFRLAYGPCSEAQAVVDAPLGEISSLVMMLDRENLPSWANETVKNIYNGLLLEEVTKAALMVL